MPNIGPVEILVLVVPVVVVAWLVIRSRRPPNPNPTAMPFRPSSTRAKAAMVLVGVTTVVLTLEAVVVVNGFSLIDNPATTVFDVEEWQRNLSGTAGLYVLSVLGSAVAFLAWLSRAVENTPALGGGQPAHSPREAIGWWFVPVANFFVPYQIVADLWRRMAPSPTASSVAIVATWWVLWIGGAVAGQIAPRASVETIEQFRGLLAASAIALLAQIVSGGLLIRIVWEVEGRVRVRALTIESAGAAFDSAPFAVPLQPAHVFSPPAHPAIGAGSPPDAETGGSLPDRPSSTSDGAEARLATLARLRSSGTISEEEFATRRMAILDEI